MYIYAILAYFEFKKKKVRVFDLKKPSPKILDWNVCSMIYSLLVYLVAFNTDSSSLGSTRFWILIVYNTRS